MFINTWVAHTGALSEEGLRRVGRGQASTAPQQKDEFVEKQQDKGKGL